MHTDHKDDNDYTLSGGDLYLLVSPNRDSFQEQSQASVRGNHVQSPFLLLRTRVARFQRLGAQTPARWTASKWFDAQNSYHPRWRQTRRTSHLSMVLL